MPPRYSREITQPIAKAGSLKDQFRTSPCEATCPAGNPIQKMLSLVEKGNFEEALRYLHAKNPFPGMTGRTCPHFCQGACNREGRDGCVGTRGIERACADFGGVSASYAPRPATGRRVSVVGGGPAGLTSAYFLALLGHEVSVYESAPVLGGMPRHAIPAFRLPRDVSDREIGRILGLGVRAYVNTTIGRDISFADLKASSDAVVVATGAPAENVMNIPGAEYAVKGVEFLHRVALGEKPELGGKVVVIGGGGTAFDCASTARRLGAEATILYRRTQADMPAPLEDQEQARDENIEVSTCCVVSEILVDNGVVTGVRCHDVTSCSKAADGTVSCEAVAGTERVLDCSAVVMAVGMRADLAFLEGALPRTKRGFIETVDHAAEGTVFACGDVAVGPASIAEAIGSGRETAFAVHAALTGESADVWAFDESGRLEARNDLAGKEAPHVVQLDEIYGIDGNPAAKAVEGSVDKDLAALETRLGFTREQAMEEAARCYHCGHCKQCGTCVSDCPGYVLAMQGPEGAERPEVCHGEECWHCANCRTSCPCGAIGFTFPLFMQV